MLQAKGFSACFSTWVKFSASQLGWSWVRPSEWHESESRVRYLLSKRVQSVSESWTVGMGCPSQSEPRTVVAVWQSTACLPQHYPPSTAHIRLRIWWLELGRERGSERGHSAGHWPGRARETWRERASARCWGHLVDLPSEPIENLIFSFLGGNLSKQLCDACK